jgi:hypothetical protein
MVSTPKVRLKALDFIANELGKSGLPALIHFAGRHPVREVRHHAVALVTKLDALEHVNLEASLELDFNQARSCKDKRVIIRQLADLNTPKAKQVLIRARDIQVKDGWFKKRYKHACVRHDIIQALSKMKKEMNQ